VQPLPPITNDSEHTLTD